MLVNYPVFICMHTCIESTFVLANSINFLLSQFILLSVICLAMCIFVFFCNWFLMLN